MAHNTPRILEIGAVMRLSIFADDKAGGGALNGQVDDGGGVRHGFDAIGGAVLGELHGAVLGVEVAFVVREVGVGELVGTPEVWEGLVWVEDLGVELGSRPDSAIEILDQIRSWGN